MAPFAQATIVEHLQFVGNDEWHDATTQTLLEHHETPHTAIAVLERMNLLEADMKVDNQVDAAEVVHRLHYMFTFSVSSLVTPMVFVSKMQRFC